MTAAVDSFVELVKVRDWVSFVELRQHLQAHGIETDGKLTWEACPNGVIWAGMSQQFCDVVDAVRDDGRIMLDSGNYLAYYADGEALKLPVAKRPPRNPEKGYATPRWLPAFFRLRSKVKS